MTTFVLRLVPPRPNFAMTMSEEEAELMSRHAEHWQPHLEAGQVAVFGPVADDTGSWGLCVADFDDEAELRDVVDSDPTVHSGRFRMEVGTLLTGFVRPA